MTATNEDGRLAADALRLATHSHWKLDTLAASLAGRLESGQFVIYPVAYVKALESVAVDMREHVVECSGCTGSTQGYCGLSATLDTLDKAKREAAE